MKTCLACTEVKAFSEFSRRSRSPDGRNYYCKLCDNARRAAFHSANRDKQLPKMRAYYAANRERHAELGRRWEAEHPAEKAEYGRRYRAAHPEKSAERSSRYRARLRGAPVIEKIDRFYVYARDGGRCHICGKKAAKDKFDLDHLVPISKGGEHTHQNLRVAHPGCNRSRADGRIPAQLLLIA